MSPSRRDTHGHTRLVSESIRSSGLRARFRLHYCYFYRAGGFFEFGFCAVCAFFRAQVVTAGYAKRGIADDDGGCYCREDIVLELGSMVFVSILDFFYV